MDFEYCVTSRRFGATSADPAADALPDCERFAAATARFVDAPNSKHAAGQVNPDHGGVRKSTKPVEVVAV
jgi:hypothetical protein